jgi:hypothetical protein
MGLRLLRQRQSKAMRRRLFVLDIEHDEQILDGHKKLLLISARAFQR